MSYLWILQRPNEEAGTAIPTLEFGIAVLFWLGELHKYGGPCAYCPRGTHATGSCKHGRHMARHFKTVRVIKNFMLDWNVRAELETPHIFGAQDRRPPPRRPQPCTRPH